MSLDRRQFLKGMLAGSASAVACTPTRVEARGNLTMPPKAMGLLFDSTLCIGCKACVAACKEANGLPPEFTKPDDVWDTPLDISGKTKNIIKVYRHGSGLTKDAEVDGYAFMKHSCLHCVDPSCVSACPVSAMRKDPVDGIVSYDEKACIGCRYCVVACPFSVPKFEYDKALPKIVKCELCRHLKPGDAFQYPACAQVCPTGATLYGPVADLKAEAQRRLALKPGSEAEFPRGRIGMAPGDKTADATTWASPSQKASFADSHVARVPHYLQRIYGDKELGGTQVLKLSAVPMAKLGMPELPERSFASVSETMQHSLYGYLITPAIVLGGLIIAARRNVRPEEDEAGQAQENE
ncbi:Fe-S-cluster-containing dehydrogenase component [Sulfuritortus calidifontis]|uniref:Fe-S-cluster-containing dehydrogenase component n=1 Tax=Sulfuritortus calidifontis TaxID=1914471 RepID=A0A4R3JV41_9PROT|nr:hydrogenase 2 operon protein HybA [Sulfuritortus calidifontis]TCS71719.1 Fe-S-cluster-containing dehydrogenase component [Sulfuritortus calidifontis]